MSNLAKRIVLMLVVLLLVTACRPTATVVSPTVTSVPSLPTDVLSTLTVVPSPTNTQIPATTTPTLPPTTKPIPTTQTYELIMDLSYGAVENPDQSLSIYLPTAARRNLTLLVQGGEYYPGMLRYFAELGYPVIAFNARGGTYQEEIQDGFCALAWAHANVKIYGLDAAGIIPVGGSMWGGNAALLGLVDDPASFLEECPYPLPETNRVRGVITLAGVFDYSEEEDFFDGFIGNISDFMGGTPEQAPENWVAASAINWVQGDEPPFLLIHGGADTNVAPRQSEKFAAVLEGVGTDVELVLLPGVNHSTSVTDRRVFEAMLAFLEGLEPPTSSTADSEVINAGTVDRLERVVDFDLPDSFVNTIVFSPDSQPMITGDRNGEVLMWERDTWERITYLPAQSTRAADSEAQIGFWGTLALSPDGGIIVTAYGDDGIVTGRDKEGQELFTFSYGARVYGVAISPNGRFLAVGGLKNTVTIFDFETRQAVIELVSDFEYICNLAFSPNGNTLLASYERPENVLKIWDTTTWQETTTFPHSGERTDYHDALFSPDGDELVIATIENVEITFLDIATKEIVREFPEHSRGPYQIAFSPDSSLLASASDDGTLRFWDMETGVNVKTIRVEQEVGAVAFSSDGTLIAFSVWGEGVQVWAVSP